MKYSEEEKKAINDLKYLLKRRYEDEIETYNLFGPIETALNLIDKQQKEIERQVSLIKFDVKYRNQLEQDLYENASNYVVPKKAIREKIKWIEDNILENEYASSKDKDIAEYHVDILKELLGE